MTVQELLDTMPKETREEMAAFYYSRIPYSYRFIHKDITDPLGALKVLGTLSAGIILGFVMVCGAIVYVSKEKK